MFVCAEYVNAQEIPTDMKSITDRAAQTLLWTELFRGQLNINTVIVTKCFGQCFPLENGLCPHDLYVFFLTDT